MDVEELRKQIADAINYFNEENLENYLVSIEIDLSSSYLDISQVKILTKLNDGSLPLFK